MQLAKHLRRSLHVEALNKVYLFIYLLILCYQPRMVFKNSLNHFAVYFFSQVVHVPLEMYLDYSRNLRKSGWKVNV